MPVQLEDKSYNAFALSLYIVFIFFSPMYVVVVYGGEKLSGTFCVMFVGGDIMRWHNIIWFKVAHFVFSVCKYNSTCMMFL